MTATTRYFAPCPKGLELLLVDELKAMGAVEAREAPAGAHFSGDATLGMRACLWSRLASRVLLPLTEFPAPDATALYEGISGIRWEEHLAPDRTLAVDALGRTEGLVNTVFVAQRSKDAVVDRLRSQRGDRPDVDPRDPDLRINVVLRQGRAIVSIDLAGMPLHQRGWRFGAGEAPLKENLACAMLLRARWPEVHAAGGPLVDPMCGSGTLLIEGALMAADVAPGIGRGRFGFHGWSGLDEAAWTRLRDEAQARARAGLQALQPVYTGADVNAAVLGAAKRNARDAGVAGFLHLHHTSVARLAPPPQSAPGLVVTNPPYGERMGGEADLAATYRELGDALRAGFAGWRAAFITNDEDLARATGLRATRHYRLYNGAIECRFHVVDAIASEAPAPREPKPLSEGARSLCNRIDKNLKHLRPRLKREDVTCFRAYDADMPEYAAAIDVYTEADAPRTWLHVQEYAPPPEIPAETARRRFGEIVRAAGEAFGVPRERIALKQRRPQTRRDRYQRVAERGEALVVAEGGLRFEVNLFDYLDTGLFLDHRQVRARLRELARGKRLLNLFAYTGSATVYAADGGAAATTTVDLSATYLEWAQRNLALNGFAGANQRLVQADSMTWLEREQGTFDLIFVDPPTFSNSRRAGDFDVQLDHVRLLTLCAARLARDGLIVFSNNFRKFKLDIAALEGLAVQDVTRRTIPFDFARDPKIHHCFELRHRSPG